MLNNCTEPKTKKNPFANSIAGIFLFTAFIFTSYFSFYKVYDQVLLLKNGVTTDAIVTGVETIIGKKQNTRYVKYKIKNNNNNNIIYSREASKELFHKALSIYRKKNKGTIKVYTLPNDSSVNSITVSYEEALKNAGIFLFSIFMCIFSIKLLAGSFAQISATVFFICLFAGLGNYFYHNFLNN